MTAVMEDHTVGTRSGRGVRLFSSVSEAERVRRPTDYVLLILGGVLLGISAIASSAAGDTEAATAALIQSLPHVFDGLWAVAADLPLVWAVGLVVVALVARARGGLVRDQLLAGLLAGVAAMLCHRLVESSWPTLDDLLGNGQPVTFPAGRLAVAIGMIVTAAPHLGRPLRYAGRWVVALGTIGTVWTLEATPGGTIAGLIVGTMAAAGVHLLFGSPGGRPSLREVAAAVGDLGVDAQDLRPAELQPAGVWTVLGRGAAGEPLVIKVYGRDAWDTQMVTQAWRFLWYRNSSARLRLSREGQVEHEGLLLLLASSAGVAAPKVRAAGRSLTGDSLLVVEPVVEPGAVGTLDRLWRALGAAHDAGVSPCSIDVDDLGWNRAGDGAVGSWAGGTTAPDEGQRRQDQAQLLIATSLMTSRDDAIAAALAALGDDGAADIVPYLQVSSVPPSMRRRVDDLDDSIEGLRNELSTRLGIEEPELVQLRRISLGAIVQMALLVLAGSAIISAFAGLDFEEVADEVQSLTLAGILTCFVMAQIARVSGVISTMGASPVPLPVGPVAELQYVVAYIGLAVPSAVGRLAVMMRFFQRVGGSSGIAVGVSAIDSAANFIVQIALLVIICGFGLGTLDFGLTSALGELESDSATFVLIVAVVLVVGVAIVLAVPKLRNKVVPVVAQVKEGLQSLRSPAKVAMVFGGNALTQILYGLTLASAAAATGADVGIADAVLINTVVTVFAGVLPIPGGVGVSEAGLTAGLVATGMTEPAALCAALLHRLMTAYVPPVAGFFAMRTLREQKYL
ncbi:MAG: lysylphosphatidylglycerol synthase transmembrane domain-containing protein [Acidimicrobiales bacterium]